MLHKNTSRGYAVLLSAAIATGLAATLALGQPLVDKTGRDEVARVAKDDPVMAQAMHKARETLPDFLAQAASPKPGTQGFSVKVAVHDGDEVEYFWIHPFQRNGEQFSGRLNHQPRTVHNVAFGQTLTFLQNEIVDWTYTDGNRMQGNYTARALLKNASPAERAVFKQRFNLDLDF
jgi:uncharacterized protein YegJ (DUF2314 family)